MYKGGLPNFITEDGQRLAESNALIRYIGRVYKGKKGEVLYPDNS
jgi:hypothetical protein